MSNDSGGKRRRASASEKQDRIDAAIRALASDFTFSAIVRGLMTQHKISERQAKRYVQDAQNEIGLIADPENTYQKGLCYRRNNDLFSRFMAKGDFGMALKANDNQAKAVQKFSRIGGRDARTPITTPRVTSAMEEALRLFENKQSTE